MLPRTRQILILFALFSFVYWLVPLGRDLTLQPTQPTEPTWPTINSAPEDDLQRIIVRDPTPHIYVQLQTSTETLDPDVYGIQNNDGTWEWQWLIPPDTPFTLYHSCNGACVLWSDASLTDTDSMIETTAPEVSTKLGLVFANPQRNWHGKRGWDVEITYAILPEDETDFWGINDLAQRVQTAHANGLNVLIRVEYAQGQNIPPTDDALALADYLAYVERIAQDDRLKDAYGLIIGSNFNTNGGNQAGAPVTPDWYARVFNGHSLSPTRHDNVLETIRQVNPTIRVLVGPVNPHNQDQDGANTNTIDTPWLNYMNTLVAHIDATAQAKAQAGFANTAPDGFAVQAFGKVADLENPAQEPTLDLHDPAWGDAQMGFRVYQDWLAIINAYPTTFGRPVYINATNTFDPSTGITPAQNYPTGWLTTAFETISQEPQIHALCWFMDGFPHDEQWANFSLITPRAKLIGAAEELKSLLAKDH